MSGQPLYLPEKSTLYHNTLYLSGRTLGGPQAGSERYREEQKCSHRDWDPEWMTSSIIIGILAALLTQTGGKWMRYCVGQKPAQRKKKNHLTAA